MDLTVWNMISDNLSEKKENSAHDFAISFLKKELCKAPDNYSGDDLEYYFSVSDRCFFTVVRHWDGGNMFANYTGRKNILTKQQLVDALNERKQLFLKAAEENNRAEFIKIYDKISEMLLSWID